MALPIQKINSRLEGEFVFRGRPYSVPFTLPGDLVQFKLSRKTGRLGMEVLHIEKAHNTDFALADPFCAVYGRCGGCRGQHIPYPKQIELKTTDLVRAMEGLGKKPEILVAPRLQGHRNRMDFVVDAGVTGFREAREFARFVDVDLCPAERDQSNRVLEVFRSAIERHKDIAFVRESGEGIVKYATIRSGSTSLLSITIEASRSENQRYLAFLQDLIQTLPPQCSLVETHTVYPSDVSNPSGGKVHVGDGTYTDRLGGLDFRVAADSFFQPNPEAFDLLLDHVMAWFGPGDVATERLVDLYCGTAVLSAIFTNRFPGDFASVYGADFTESAIAHAPGNLKHFSDPVRFEALDLAQKMVPLLPGDFVILDPPRAGLAPQVLRSVLDGLPERVLYISCNPQTQLRDLRALTSTYRIDSAVISDCYPHTQHLEQAVFLRKL
ncbi:MAG TPA: hypothetical protein PK881_11240 [Leptospiraceae bacterium]|nr:hypothetical protein [Leptospiraceae bacterium]HNJ34807.1 hypothetical protein [Leptospiraceae bacterium]